MNTVMSDAVRAKERIAMSAGKLHSSRDVATDELPAYLDKIVAISMSGRSFSFRQLYRLVVAAFRGKRIDLNP